MVRRLLTVIGVALAVLALDQATKLWVMDAFAHGESVQVLPFFALTYVQNRGAAWGMFQGSQLPLALFGLLAIALGCVFWRKLLGDHRWTPALGGLLIGGVVGNLIDRLRLEYVVDFLDFHWGVHHFPCFNVADSAICVGVALVILLQWLAERRAKKGE